MNVSTVISATCCSTLAIRHGVEKLLRNTARQLKENNQDDINVIVTADHGMTSVSSGRVIYLADLIDMSLVCDHRCDVVAHACGLTMFVRRSRS